MVVKKVTEMNTWYIKDTSDFIGLIQQRHTEDNTTNPIVLETGLGVVIQNRLM